MFRLEANYQKQISDAGPMAKLYGYSSCSRAVLNHAGDAVSRVRKGPHVNLTQEIDKVKTSKLVFGDNCVTKATIYYSRLQLESSIVASRTPVYASLA